ncbi:MAG: hypothetical protein ACFCU1_10390 [Sumerlaeia bacterium]
MIRASKVSPFLFALGITMVFASHPVAADSPQQQLPTVQSLNGEASEANPTISPAAESVPKPKPIFNSVEIYKTLFGQNQVFNRRDNGERITPIQRTTIESAKGTIYTISNDGSWVGYRLTDEGVYVDLLRNSEFETTIVLSKPWLMFPREMKIGEQISATIPFDLYNKDKKGRSGKVEWSAIYKGLASIDTPLKRFDHVHKIESQMNIDFPFKFGLKFKQTHYFSEEFGEIYRLIDGDATFAGISIRDRELIESIASSEHLPVPELIEAADALEKNIEGITIQVEVAQPKPEQLKAVEMVPVPQEIN